MYQKSWITKNNLPAPFDCLNQLYRGPYKMAMHSHPFWQMILVTSGSLHVTTEFNALTMHAGTIHILPPNMNHELYSPEGYSQIGIDLKSIEHSFMALLKEQFTEPVFLNSEQLLPMAVKIDELYHQGSPLANAKMWNLVDAVILHCLEHSITSLQDHWNDVFFAYIYDHLHLPLKLSEIAEHFFISVPQLERRCRKYFHCGVFTLLQQQRFKKAQQLLLSTDLPIREIGASVGYPDAAHFSDFFKKHAGVSPREYRNQGRWYA